MKTVFALFFTFTLLCSMFGTKVCGQVVAIGHVTAEVVESVSASSMAITAFNLKKSDSVGGSILTEQTSLSMGTITINSAASIACNLVMRSATLTDNKGNGFTIEPTIMTSGQGITAQANGTQSLKINGITH